jgi:Mitochondrial carrier protein
LHLLQIRWHYNFWEITTSFAGFVTSFLVVPIERIKVMMQAQKGSTKKDDDINSENQHYYQNELECFQAIIKQEGIRGFLLRGLGPTLAREVPSFAIYFVVYALFLQSSVGQSIGTTLAPLLGGALAGCTSWLPVYPIDVVKTIVQNTDGTSSTSTSSTWDVIQDLYEEGGVGAFFDGLTPKLLRAAINHAVTFFLYDTIISLL